MLETATTKNAEANPKNRSDTVEFPNFWSRLFLKRIFERQFIVPEDPPWLLARLLTAYEKWCMHIDISQIGVDRPIFLIGLPRSGTTMLQDVICTHPSIAYINNTMNQFRTCFCGADSLRRRLRLDVRGDRFVGDSVSVDSASPNEGFGFWGTWFNWDPDSHLWADLRIKDFSSEQIEEIKTAIRKVIWCFGPAARRFFSKNPGLIADIDLLNELFPDARFVNIVRDARTCANSMLKLNRKSREQIKKIEAGGRSRYFSSEKFVAYPRLPGLARYIEQFGADDIRTTAHLWNEAMDFVDDRKDQLPAYYEVRYEDILKDPRAEVERVLEFCELPLLPEQAGALEKKLQSVGVVRHRNQYSHYDVIESICRDNMERRGYQ